VAKWSALKSWAVRVAQRRGAKRGKVALARKLAVVLHRIYGPAAFCKMNLNSWSFGPRQSIRPLLGV
jgi:hypothetical protein